MDDERTPRVEKEIALDATPDQVWEAVSTAHGLSTWFVPHAGNDTADTVGDDSLSADFGGGQTQGGRILAWEPGRRVVYGAPPESGQPEDFALEFLVEGAQGSTVLRLIHSGFSAGEDWEGEYEGTSLGWELFLHNLASYFRHFAPRPVTNVVALVFSDLGADEVWQRYHARLGVVRDVSVGDTVALTPDGLDAVHGVVDVHAHGVLGVRTEDGLYRFLGAGPGPHGMVNVAHYLYGADRVDAAATTEAWQRWLTELVA